ncbi:plasmid mobilization relaxosome protein MobC [Adlercreutzia sp. ZJ473]|uniref:plasmid mobilization protein n=1 Tax=Adlercreutzia sp. ZJ473 TaxID=2722822 RepID=UPI001551A99B|nr:plasmid mobilization relaxosome protein MobC [Adlercreutzia sp. ZJ473]
MTGKTKQAHPANKSRWLSLRLSSSQHARVESAAARSGLNVSEYARRRLLRDDKRPRIVVDASELKALLAQVRKAGGNLNQLQREVNTRHQAEELAPEISAAIAAVSEAASSVCAFIAESRDSI